LTNLGLTSNLELYTCLIILAGPMAADVHRKAIHLLHYYRKVFIRFTSLHTYMYLCCSFVTQSKVLYTFLLPYLILCVYFIFVQLLYFNKQPLTMLNCTFLFFIYI